MIEQLLAVIQAILAAAPVILGAVSSLLLSLIAIFALIPGDQPEKALQALVDAIAKISNKPKSEE